MKILAITNCRVSTSEQRLNNSLNRQQQSVLEAAGQLGAEIVKEWSGDVSSKAGTNVKRKDLQEMLEYCKKYKGVKYLIVDEPDRFMRSADEGMFFEVAFRMEGVKVWYASNPELNGDDLQSKMLKFMKYFAAEGSNVERQTKSINGHVAALKEGRYTFPPKPGYIKGSVPGVHRPHPLEFKPLQKAFKEVASGLYTPSEAHKRLNESDFTREHAPMKIDRFLHFLADPYYAGILEMNKQVKARCEVGLHEQMITLEQHKSIQQALAGRKRLNVKKKQHNPEFPLSKVLVHDCQPEAKFTGSVHHNGHGGHYPKYNCRVCWKQYKRSDVHEAVGKLLSHIDYTDIQRDELIKALSDVWHEKQQDKLRSRNTLDRQLGSLKELKSKMIRQLSSSSAELSHDIEVEITKIKDEMSRVHGKLQDLEDLQEDLIDFVKFSLEYTNVLKDDWWQLDGEQRIRCQQLLFPEKITYNLQGKVGTTKISSLYRLKANKKDLRIDRKSLMVELAGIAPASASLLLILLQA